MLTWIETKKSEILQNKPKNYHLSRRNNKSWRKVKDEDIVFMKLCTHEGITDWDCACSIYSDCNSCHLHYYCPNCGLLASNAPLAILYTQKEKEIEDARNRIHQPTTQP